MTWRTIDDVPDDRPLKLFSPYADDLNCKGGLIWISGGKRDTHGFRGDHAIEPPTHWDDIGPSPLDEPPQEQER